MSIHTDISTLMGSLKAFLETQNLTQMPAAQPLITKMHKLENELENVILNVWSVEDVTCMMPKLTDDEARQVLRYVESNFDAEYGICWDSLYQAARELRFDTGDEFSGDDELDFLAEK